MLTYKIEKESLRVTTSAANGNETTVLIGYEMELAHDAAGKVLHHASDAAVSVRAAALTLIHSIQEKGMLKPWFGGGKVVQDMLKKMKEAEEIVGAEFGLVKEDWAELRKPGQYADTRSQAMKAWSFGVALKVGESETTGHATLLTTNGLRKINAAHRKAPEEKGVDSYLDALAEYLTEHPQDVVEAQSRIFKIMSDARALLDASQRQELAAEDSPATGAEEAKAGEVVAAEAPLRAPHHAEEIVSA